MDRVESIVGLRVDDLLAISEKLAILGLDPTDILEFLDRDKVQLFAELKVQIACLEGKLGRIDRIISEESNNG